MRKLRRATRGLVRGLIRLAVSPQQLFGTRFGEHVPRLGHIHQLRPVLGVAHLTSKLSAFVSVRLILRNLLHPTGLLRHKRVRPDTAVVETNDCVEAS